MAQLNHEPSMEDILASIKRIIAEDSEAAAPRAARPIRREMASVPPEPALRGPLGVVTEAKFEPLPAEAAVPREPIKAPEPVKAAEPIRAPEPEPVAEVDQEPDVEPTPVVAAAPEPAPVAPPKAVEPEPADVLELTSPIAEEVAPAKSMRPKSVASVPTPPEPVSAEPLQSPKEPVTMDRLMSDNAATASRTAFAALTQLQVRADAGQENTLEGLVADLLRPMLREWLDRELPALVERLVSAEIGRVSGRNL